MIICQILFDLSKNRLYLCPDKMDWTAIYVMEKHTALITGNGIASSITNVFINRNLMQNERKTDQ